MQPQSEQDKMLLEYLMSQGMLSPEDEMLQRREARLAKMRDSSRLSPGQMVGNQFVAPSGAEFGVNLLTQGLGAYNNNALENEQQVLAQKRQEAFRRFAERAASQPGYRASAPGGGMVDTVDYSQGP